MWEVVKHIDNSHGNIILDIYFQKLAISLHNKIIRSSRWQMFFKIGVL